MTPEELRIAINLGREQRNTEFKGPGERTDKAFLAKVIRAILGMANKPDGGIVILGVDDDGTSLNATGLTVTQLRTWNYDDLHTSVSNYADPFVDFEVNKIDLDNKSFVAVEVTQFAELPVICKRDFQHILRNSALYVRRRGKIETVEVQSHVEMREVLERAAEVMARKIIGISARLKLEQPTQPQVSEADKFAKETEDLL